MQDVIVALICCRCSTKIKVICPPSLQVGHKDQERPAVHRTLIQSGRPRHLRMARCIKPQNGQSETVDTNVKASAKPAWLAVARDEPKNQS